MSNVVEHNPSTSDRTSIRAQLDDWHADRGNKTFAQSIIPSWKHHTNPEDVVIYNPITLIRMLSMKDWAYFFCGWFAWTCDGFDYFAVSVTMAQLSEQFGKSTAAVSEAITLTLLFRSVGAIVFGIAADRFGRKWTLVINLLLICVFEIGSGLCNTYQEFLGVRAMFGIVMGGIWGQAAATALENVPVQARGLLSGMMQQGYAVGYLLAAVFNLTVATYAKAGWRSVYFVGAGFSFLAAVLRACLPESRQYIEARRLLAEEGKTKGNTKRFFKEMWNMLKANWIRCIWGVLVMTGFNFLSHGSQDLYPTYLKVTKGLSPALANKATIISNVGAICGGTLAGYISQYCGRRLTAMVFLVITAVWIPLWILPSSFGGLSAGGFWVQFGVQGTWGIVPIYLGEVSPPAFRASFAGVAYQLGNMASSGAAQIEADAGKTLTTHDKNGKKIPDYATIQGILIGVVIAWLFVWLFLGPEADGAHFEQAKIATQEGGGLENRHDLMAPRPSVAHPVATGKEEASYHEDQTNSVDRENSLQKNRTEV